MKDQILNERVKLFLEDLPGIWKMNEAELDSLVESLGDFLIETYSRGSDDGFDRCMESIREGARGLYGITI